jgi:hypothetical protein
MSALAPELASKRVELISRANRYAFVVTDRWPVALTNRELEAIKDT